jgi:3-methyladenine DNA glycosylase AlkC
MKDGLGASAVDRLARSLVSADPGFDAPEFRKRGLAGLGTLELKARVGHLTDALAKCLPDDYPRALEVVRQAGRAFPEGDPADPLNGFAAWPLVDWVAAYGLDHFDVSLEALRDLTGLFSAEFAVRPFLIHDAGRALVHFHRWTADPDEHVRRLASEGSRPRLPWGRQLPMFRADPAPVLPLLENLADDPSEYVRRSVANNLNDIAKDHPAVAVRVGRRWMKGAGPERTRLVRHALRTLVKQGDPGALKVLGFTSEPRVEASLTLEAKRVRIGDSLAFEIELVSSGARRQKLVIDYAVHHRRANGSCGRKVFKLRNASLDPGEVLKLRKSHSFAPRSVRRYYSGRYRIELLVGGRSLAEAFFDLSD